MKRKKIYCLAEACFQKDGTTDLKGGGERWMSDFLTLLKGNNYDIRVFQFSYEEFTKKWRGHTIHGLGNITNKMYPMQGYESGLNNFNEMAIDDNADGIFYLSMNLSHSTMPMPVLTVSHGLMIDRCEREECFNPSINLDALKKWVRNSTHTISVDTNTIKVNAVYFAENIKKMTYVPNYVDLDVFKPFKKEDNSKFTVLFPRRLDVARGYRQAMQACEQLLAKYDNFEFIFCGQGNPKEEREFEIWYNSLFFKDRVQHYAVEPDKMYEVYQKADISIIPTLFAEGTSLSCLESLASGVVPIVSCVGGLTDLVFPNVNGLMVMPNNVEQLVESIEYLYDNLQEKDRMKNNGLEMVKSFDKKMWEEKIIKVVNKVYGGN